LFIEKVRASVRHDIETQLYCVSSRIESLEKDREDLLKLRAKYMGF
jgi:hypothetical protein